MISQILQKAYEDILNDTKLIRIATITTIIYSFIFVIYILYQTYFVISNMISEIELETLNIIFNFLENIFNNPETIIYILITIIILGTGYFLLPPIADGTLIYYISTNREKGNGTKAISKGIRNFYYMFEYYMYVSVVSFIVYFIALGRFFVLGVLENTFVAIIMIIWFILIILTSIFFKYSKFIIIFENKSPIEAIKKSVVLSLENFGITIKFVLISFLLYIRFVINIIILIGIPRLFIFILNAFNIYDIESISYILYGIFLLLTLFTAYINGIIEAFFVSYWYKVYSQLKHEEE